MEVRTCAGCLPIRLDDIVRLRCRSLQRFFSTFPAGAPGIGLLLLRIASASAAIAGGMAHFPAPRPSGAPLALIETGAGVLLLAGFLTPFTGAALAMFNLKAVFLRITFSPYPCPIAHSLFMASVAAGIALLGPGALSIDARLFGRHRIIIPPPR